MKISRVLILSDFFPVCIHMTIINDSVGMPVFVYLH